MSYGTEFCQADVRGINMVFVELCSMSFPCRRESREIVFIEDIFHRVNMDTRLRGYDRMIVIRVKNEIS
jgi:hypothetical protein